MKMLPVAAAAAALMMTAGCATDRYGYGGGAGYGPGYGYGPGPAPVGENTAGGAALGALGGCILGAATDNSCLGGAALGAVVGGAIGYYRDQRCDREYCGERDNVRVYYDNRCRDYYYLDRNGRAFWENGQPRWGGRCSRR